MRSSSLSSSRHFSSYRATASSRSRSAPLRAVMAVSFCSRASRSIHAALPAEVLDLDPEAGHDGLVAVDLRLELLDLAPREGVVELEALDALRLGVDLLLCLLQQRLGVAERLLDQEQLAVVVVSAAGGALAFLLDALLLDDEHAQLLRLLGDGLAQLRLRNLDARDLLAHRDDLALRVLPLELPLAAAVLGVLAPAVLVLDLALEPLDVLLELLLLVPDPRDGLLLLRLDARDRLVELLDLVLALLVELLDLLVLAPDLVVPVLPLAQAVLELALPVEQLVLLLLEQRVGLPVLHELLVGRLEVGVDLLVPRLQVGVLEVERLALPAQPAALLVEVGAGGLGGDQRQTHLLRRLLQLLVLLADVREAVLGLGHLVAEGLALGVALRQLQLEVGRAVDGRRELEAHLDELLLALLLVVVVVAVLLFLLLDDLGQLLVALAHTVHLGAASRSAMILLQTSLRERLRLDMLAMSSVSAKNSPSAWDVSSFDTSERWAEEKLPPPALHDVRLTRRRVV
ncbi:hypothetical protein ColKHC_05222 [Colletotrichum higginsianum]|nr:hypothetical protein ColKHC_05222 [Colletotrichum higginsianum]